MLQSSCFIMQTPGGAVPLSAANLPFKEMSSWAPFLSSWRGSALDHGEGLGARGRVQNRKCTVWGRAEDRLYSAQGQSMQGGSAGQAWRPGSALVLPLDCWAASGGQRTGSLSLSPALPRLDAWDKCSGLVHWEDPDGWDGEGGWWGDWDGEHM